MPVNITEADIRDYLECGVTVVRSALTPAQVETLRRGIDRHYKNTDADSECTEKDPAKVKQFDSFPCYRDHPEYEETIFKTDLPKIAALLSGSRTVRFHHEQIHVEVPKVEERTPWHEDDLFYNADGDMNLSIFVAVDPIPEGNAEFVLGSHKLPSSMPRYLRDLFAKDLSEKDVPLPLDVEAKRRELPVVSWALQPGDAFVFSFRTLHLLKSATALRRGMSVRFIGDDATYAPRPWRTFPHFPQLEKDLEGMKVGGPMTHSLFPIAYTRDAKL